MSKGKKPGGNRPGRPGVLPPLGGLGNRAGIMSQVQKMQEEMAKTQEALGSEEVTATSGGGVVTVVAAGNQTIKSLTIKPEAVSADDVEMLQDMILAAVNEALEKARALEQERMGSLTGGLGLPPGLF